MGKKKRRQPKEVQSVFESVPAVSSADTTATSDFAAVDDGKTTFESQPAVSRADTSCMGASLAATSEQSAFESNPAASKADITWTTEVTTYGDAVSGNDTSQSVFESRPKESVANARSGAEG